MVVLVDDIFGLQCPNVEEYVERTLVLCVCGGLEQLLVSF